MAHPAQEQFCLEVKQRFPQAFCGRRVLEIGAKNVNGSFRGEFIDCDDIGVDCEAGNGVDVVCLAHEYAAEPDSFDTVYSTETFEHDPYAERTIARMLRLLKPGGLLFGTCAGEGRPEHGTQRTGKRYGPEADFYRNVSVRQFLEWLAASGEAVQEIHVRHNPDVHDLYFYAVKAGRR